MFRRQVILRFALAGISFFSNYAQCQWIESNRGIVGGAVSSISRGNNLLVAGTKGGVYFSGDNANSWQKIVDGLDNADVLAVVISNNGNIFASCNDVGEIYVSRQPYANFTKSNSGLATEKITSIKNVSGILFALAASGNLFFSANDGSSWSQTAFVEPISWIDSNGQSLFAVTDQKVFFTNDGSTSWKELNTSAITTAMYAIAVSKNYMVITTRIGATYFSRDNGNVWLPAALESVTFKLIEFGTLLIAANESKSYFSSNAGITWDQVRGLPGAYDVTAVGSGMVACNKFGIYSSINGSQWQMYNNTGLSNGQVVGFASSEKNLFAATTVGSYRSGDLGKNWIAIGRGLPLDVTTAISFGGGRLLVALQSYGIYFSDNEGDSWSFSNGIARINCLTKTNTSWLAGAINGCYRSLDNGTTWEKIFELNMPVEKIFAKGDSIFLCSSTHGIFFSSNEGRSWQSYNQGLIVPGFSARDLTYFNNSFYVGGLFPSPMFRTLGPPTFWQEEKAQAFASGAVYALTANQSNLFSAINNGVLRFTSGASWSDFFSEGLPKFSSRTKVELLFIYRQHLVAGTTGNGVWISCVEPDKPSIYLVPSEKGDSVLSSSSSVGNQWYLNGELIDGAIGKNYRPKNSGVYTTQVTIEGCSSQLSNSKFVEVKEYPDASILMPNVFTPNDDNLNQAFVPILYENVDKALLKVFNRWGQEIFHSEKMEWDGGEEKNGVFFYEISFVGKNEKTGRLKGWVQLLR